MTGKQVQYSSKLLAQFWLCIVSANGPADEVQSESTHNHQKLHTRQNYVQCNKAHICVSPVYNERTQLTQFLFFFFTGFKWSIICANLMRKNHTNCWTLDLWPGLLHKRSSVWSEKDHYHIQHHNVCLSCHYRSSSLTPAGFPSPLEASMFLLELLAPALMYWTVFIFLTWSHQWMHRSF